MAERRLERGQRGKWLRRRRKDHGKSRRIDAQQDGAVLDERPAVAPLRAPDELLAADLDFAAPGAREAERGRRLVAARGAHHLDRRAQRPKPRGERAADPLVAVEEIPRATA